MNQRTEEIINKVNQEVKDYIEGKIGVGHLSHQMTLLATANNFNQLKNEKMEEIIGVIDIASDLDKEMSQFGYNPNDINSAQQFLERYYKKIKV